MTENAAGEILSPNFPFARTHAELFTMPKRKTPLELRGEQLKRRRSENESSGEKKLTSSLAPGVPFTSKDLESSRYPEYIDTKLNELFPVKKSSVLCKEIYGQESPLNNGSTPISVCATCLHKISDPCDNAEENKQRTDETVSLEAPERSSTASKPSSNMGSRKVEKCSEITFLSVAQLSVGRDISSGCSRIDMEKALSSLVSRDDLSCNLDAHPSIATKKIQGDFRIPFDKIPLDFTLKTSMHLVFSSSVKWIHRLISSGTWNAAAEFSVPCHDTVQDRQLKNGLGTVSVPSFRNALNSWRHPQSSLPSSVLSAMSLSASTEELAFLKKRQQDWEDSFHNLYYMLRRKNCGFFYVLTHHFVALFVGDFSLSKKNRCNAYVSRSTNGLRSLLAENGISFSMPLCGSTMEQSTTEDLVKLPKIETHNLGQAHSLDQSLDVDNSPQSLLAFLGNRNVHGLFDFLLNYRYFLSSLSNFDVPVLYSPVPFRNASLFSPEVRCREMKKADFIHSSGSDMDEKGSFLNSFCHSIEIKDDILPPWVIIRILSAMASRCADFEASFTLESKSAGLNIALDSFPKLEMDSACVWGENNSFGKTISMPWLRSTSLGSLKHSKGVYTASIVIL